MFGISFEHILIVGVILLLVGPRRLPELGNTMGKAIKNFKDSFSGIEEASFKRLNPETETQSAKAPVSQAPTQEAPVAQAAPAQPAQNQAAPAQPSA
jgi:sec-independent protein translocase protein TatA